MTRKRVKGSVKFTKMSSPDAGFPISRFNFKCTAVPVSSEPMRRNQGVSLDLALSYKEDYILATEVVGLDQPIVPSNFCTERSSPALFPAGRKEAGAKKINRSQHLTIALASLRITKPLKNSKNDELIRDRS